LASFVHGESRLFFDVFPEQIQIDQALAIASEDELLGILMALAAASNGTIRLQLDDDAIETTEQRKAERWSYFAAACGAVAALVFVWLPSRKTSVPPKNMESLTIQMSRGPCRGRCPSYTITIYGTGSVEYVGERYVKERGPQTARLGREQVIAVLQSLDGAQFLAREDRAFTWCFDSASVGISVSAEGKYETSRQ
jgi:hypothetical protein